MRILWTVDLHWWLVWLLNSRLHTVTASADDDPRLLVLLSVVDLLAACSKGRNVFVQSICQTILTSDELLKVCTVCMYNTRCVNTLFHNSLHFYIGHTFIWMLSAEVSMQTLCLLMTASVFDQLLCSDQIAISRKLPFCLYLVWVYLDADLMATQTHNTLNLKWVIDWHRRSSLHTMPLTLPLLILQFQFLVCTLTVYDLVPCCLYA